MEHETEESESYEARKALFARGLRRGFLELEEIGRALPDGVLSEAERWILFASLRAARIEVRDAKGQPVDPIAGALRRVA